MIAPVAGEVLELSTVTLSAAGSSDPDGDKLTFEWKQVAGPKVELDEDHSAEITFMAPKVFIEEAVEFEVTVSDGKGGENRVEAGVLIREGEAIVFRDATIPAPQYPNRIFLRHESAETIRLVAEEPGQVEDMWVSSDRRSLVFLTGERRLKFASLYTNEPVIDLTADLPEVNGVILQDDTLFFTAGHLYRVPLDAGDPLASREEILRRILLHPAQRRRTTIKAGNRVSVPCQETVEQ